MSYKIEQSIIKFCANTERPIKEVEDEIKNVWWPDSKYQKRNWKNAIDGKVKNNLSRKQIIDFCDITGVSLNYFFGLSSK